MLRWQLEVTFQEVNERILWACETATPVVPDHAHRPHHANPDGPIRPATTLAAHLMQEQRPMSHRHRGIWYAKPSPTFVDAMRSGAAATCGWRRRVFHCPTQNRIYGKSRLPCTTDYVRFTRLRGLNVQLPEPWTRSVKMIRARQPALRDKPGLQHRPALPGSGTNRRRSVKAAQSFLTPPGPLGQQYRLHRVHQRRIRISNAGEPLTCTPMKQWHTRRATWSA